MLISIVAELLVKCKLMIHFYPLSAIIMLTMYHAPNKRKKRAQLAFIYTLMALAVVSIVAVLVLVMQGYRFNRYDGRVEQGGLMQFDSKPAGATVTMDDIVLANKTASKITVQAGTHTVSITKDGYSTWQKTVDVDPGSVTWLNYALLFPKKPVAIQAATYQSVAGTLVSPDRKYLAVLPDAQTPSMLVVTLNSTTPEQSKVTIPADVYSDVTEGVAHEFALIGWDRDGRYMLVKHGYGEGKVEYLSVDMRGGDAPRNLTRALGVDIASAEYSLASSNTLYILTANHELRRAELSSTTLTGPLVGDVATFAQPDRATVAYATLVGANGKRAVGYMTNGAAKARVVRTYSDDGNAPLQLRVGKYYGDEHMSIVYGKTVEILKGDIPSSDATGALALTQVAKYDCPAAVTHSGFSPEQNRFIVTRCGADMVSYDLERGVLARNTVAGDTGAYTAWVDSYHWSAVAGGTAAYYDFDGTNRQTVGLNALAQAATLSENAKYFYHFSQTGNTVALVRTQMTRN